MNRATITHLTVTAIGLNKTETDTLACIFRLSGKHQLVDFWSADNHDIVLVGADDPDAYQVWQSYRVENPGTKTLFISDKSHISSQTSLPKRFVQRPCFAKQVLSAIDQTGQRTIPSPVQAVGEQWAQSLKRCARQVQKKVSAVLEPLFSNSTTHNPYYHN